MKAMDGLMIILLALLALLFIITGNRFGEMMVVIFVFSLLGLVVMIVGTLMYRGLGEEEG